MSRITDTASAMEACVTAASGGEVPSRVMAHYVDSHGGDSRYLPQAAKHLRDHGVLLVARKAQHKSTWCLADNPTQVMKWTDRMQREHLSEKVSEARALALSPNPAMASQRIVVVAEAVGYGAMLGIPAGEIVVMCEPL